MKRATFECFYDVIVRAILLAGQASRGAADDQDFSVSFPTGAALDAECARWTAGKTAADKRYSQFAGCCGAGDGTLIPVCFKDDDFEFGAHRTRKGEF